MTQFSLFGAEATAPGVADLDGVLLAGGHWVRADRSEAAGADLGRGTAVPRRSGARLSVVVADRWRAEALAAAFTERGVGGDPAAIVAAEAGFGVRTVFSPDLVDYAARWMRGAREGLPAGFQLGAGGLRLWAISAGRRDDVGYLLATPPAENPIHQAAGAQLARLGVAAVALAQRGGPGWRVTSAKRLRRLVELLGPPPEGGEQDWPDPASGRL